MSSTLPTALQVSSTDRDALGSPHSVGARIESGKAAASLASPALSKKPEGLPHDDKDQDVDDDELPQLLSLDDILNVDRDGSEIFDDDQDYDEGLEEAMRKTNEKTLIANFLESDTNDNTDVKPTLTQLPETIDDFVRNYLCRKGLLKSLDAFQNEWYEMLYRGTLSPEDANVVPDNHYKTQELESTIAKLRKDVEGYKETASKAQATYDKLRKERDFHRMHHKRVMQEKSKLAVELKRLQKYTQEEYEPTIRQLQQRYESAIKERSLLKLERDKLLLRVGASEGLLATQTKQNVKDISCAVEPVEPSLPGSKTKTESNKSKSQSDGNEMNKGGNKYPTSSINRKKGGSLSYTALSAAKSAQQQDISLPIEDRNNPYTQRSFNAVDMHRFRITHTVKAHEYAISAVKFHPKKMILATVSDDKKWKMWTFPSGDLLMSGDGHKDWISDCDFHPAGSHLATASGDCTIKMWDFAQGTASLTLTDHTQAVWSCAFHDTGDILASSSMDHTAKLWDLTTGRCRQTFRSHTDSVNCITWRPYTNTLALASSDKTVSIWDARASVLCIANLHGHTNAVNHVVYSHQGDFLASSDADGTVKLWDVRNQYNELLSVDFGPQSINFCSFDPSGIVLAAASNDGTCKMFNRQEASARSVSGHEGAVQGSVFDKLHGEYLVTCGSDGTFKLWN